MRVGHVAVDCSVTMVAYPTRSLRLEKCVVPLSFSRKGTKKSGSWKKRYAVCVWSAREQKVLSGRGEKRAYVVSHSSSRLDYILSVQRSGSPCGKPAVYVRLGVCSESKSVRHQRGEGEQDLRHLSTREMHESIWGSRSTRIASQATICL